MVLEESPPLFYGGRAWEGLVLIFFFKCFVEFTSEAIWPWTSFCLEIFGYQFNLLTSNQPQILSCDSVLVDWMCLGIYPFLPGYWICWHLIVLFHEALCFCVIHFNHSSFISDLSPVLSLAKVCQFCYLFNEPALRFTDLFYFCLFIYIHCDLYLLPSIKFELLCSFTNYLRYKDRGFLCVFF